MVALTFRPCDCRSDVLTHALSHKRDFAPYAERIWEYEQVTGDEMRALRRRTGLSQADMAAAIGMSRESVGRMERGSERVEKRTELAVRYVLEFKPTSRRSLHEIYDDVVKVLEDACVRGAPSIERSQRLKAALEDWTETDGPAEMRPLLFRAQGIIGAINVAIPNSSAWSATMRDLIELKSELFALRPKVPSN